MKIELGLVVTFYPSDRTEVGIIYWVSDDGLAGKAAFIDDCSTGESFRLRVLSIEDGALLVDHHYEAEIRQGENFELIKPVDMEDMGVDELLVYTLKVAAMNPNSSWPNISAHLEETLRCCGNSVWRTKVAFGHFRKAIYNLLASENCQWLREIWQRCPDDLTG